MNVMSTVRAVPGEYGGGYGRVIGTQPLPGSGLNSGDTQSVEVVLSRLPSSFSTFASTLEKFSGDEPVKAAPLATLTSGTVTVVQQVPVQGDTAALAEFDKQAQLKAQIESEMRERAQEEETRKALEKAASSNEETVNAATQEFGNLLSDDAQSTLPPLGETKAAQDFGTSFPDDGAQPAVSGGGNLFAQMTLAAAAYAGAVARSGGQGVSA